MQEVESRRVLGRLACRDTSERGGEAPGGCLSARDSAVPGERNGSLGPSFLSDATRSRKWQMWMPIFQANREIGYGTLNLRCNFGVSLEHPSQLPQLVSQMYF